MAGRSLRSVLAFNDNTEHNHSMYTLHTSRLALNPLAEDDVDIVLALFTNPDVLKFADDVMQEEYIRENMSNWIKRGSDGCIGIWCVSDINSGTKFGTVALLPMPVDQDDTDFDLVVPDQKAQAEIEIGFYLTPKAWGRGIATEASTAILSKVFETSYLTEIVASFHPDNDASKNTLVKLGFVDHGLMRCYGATGPNYRLSRQEFLKRKKYVTRV